MINLLMQIFWLIAGPTQKDEVPAAYKDFNEVVRSVELAGLARTVATLKARFVIKDADHADD